MAVKTKEREALDRYLTATDSRKTNRKQRGMSMVDYVEEAQNKYFEDVWNDYVDWVVEEKKKKAEEELMQKNLPVKIELLKQKVRNW